MADPLPSVRLSRRLSDAYLRRLFPNVKLDLFEFVISNSHSFDHALDELLLIENVTSRRKSIYKHSEQGDVSIQVKISEISICRCIIVDSLIV